MTTQAPDRIENHDAEAAVLGSILVDHEMLWTVQGALKPEDFVLVKHRQVYEAMLSLAESGRPIDVLTITDEIARSGKTHSADIGIYLVNLIDATPSAMNALSYAESVADTARRRALLQMSSDLARRVYDKGEDVDKTVSWLTDTANGQSRGGAIKHASDIVNEVSNEFDFNYNNPLEPGQVRGLDTGWKDVNKLLGGWRPGLYVVLGEPHTGKSWFVLEAAQNVAAQGKRALLFSLEMTAQQLIRRLCLAEARISQRDYELGRVKDYQITKLYERMGEIGTWKLDIVDDMDTASSIFATIHRECRGDNPPEFVAIDYLGLIATDYRTENQNLETSRLVRNLKRLADTCQIPLAVPHQVSDKQIQMRSDKRPKKSDGYGSGGISQHSDVIIGLFNESLHTDSPEFENTLEVIKLKDRLSGGADPFTSAYLTFLETGGLRDRSIQEVPYGPTY